jgi:hypothetical protein
MYNRTSKYIVARDIRILLEDKPIASTKIIIYQGTIYYGGRIPGLID